MPWWMRLVRKSRADRQLDSELRFHLEQQVADYIASGIPPGEARRRARLEFGGLDQIKEDVHNTHWEQWLENLHRDFRFALRMLSKSKGFSSVAIVTLALGIGATTTVFSVVYNLLVQPFPHEDASRMVVASVHDLKQGGVDDNAWYSIPEFTEIRERNDVFEDVVGGYHVDVLYNHGGRVRSIFGAYVTTNNFAFFNVPPYLGRWITDSDARPGAPRVFAIGYKLWKNEFGGDPGAVGRTFILNGRPRMLIGVMPANVNPYGTLLWLPLSLDRGGEGSTGPDGGPVYLYTVERLKRGVSPEDASADLNVIARSFAKLYPKDFPEHFTIIAQRAVESLMGPFARMLDALLFAVTLLLLIACSNVANLLLARSTAREKEVAVRSALGASKGRLISQLLAESLTLGACACVAGCFLAYLSLRVISVTIPRVKIPDETLFGLDPAVLLFAMGITLLTTVACGLVPALHSVRSTLQTKLVGSGKGSTGDFRHGTLRSSLVVAEVAFSIVLLTGAGLTIQNLLALTRTRLGFDPNALLSVQFDAPASYSNQQRNAFLAQLLGRVKILPGVDAASVIHSGPPLWAVPSEISIPGRSHVERWESLVDEGGEDYCAALGLGLVAGRVLSQDDVASARAVAVVNQAFASKYFGTVSPIDRVVRFNAFDSLPQAPHSFEIVGVVTDYKNRGVIEPALPEAILPYTVDVSDISTIMVRSTVKTGAFIKAVDQASAVIDPNIAVSVAPMNAFLQDNVYEEPQFDFMGFGAFAGIGLLLVTTGVFSVMAYTVSLRTHEIGVRIALGAQPRDILRLVLNKGVRLMAAGSMLGLFGSHTIIRFAASEISGLSGATGWISCAVLVLVVGVGLFACFWPARKATRVDPLMALRYE